MPYLTQAEADAATAAGVVFADGVARGGVAALQASPSLDTAILLTRLATKPTTAKIRAYDAFYKTTRTAGILDKLDGLYLNCSVDAQASKLNLVQDLYNLTEVSAPTFDQYLGYTGNGTSSYLSTGFNPATANGNFKRDSACMGVWVGTEVDENKDDIGITSFLLRSKYAGNYVIRANSAGSTNLPNAYSSRGLLWASRTSAAGYSYGKDAEVLGYVTDTSVAVSSNNIIIGSGTVAPFATKRYVAEFFGGGLTNAEMLILANALQALVAAVSLPDVATLTAATTYQTIEGIGYELQSDSIEGDAGGVQNSNTSSLPLDLVPSERVRLAQTIAKVAGNSFTDFRLAMGLYYRGTTSDGKRFVERLSGQNAAIAEHVTLSGVKGITFTYWSPAPYWKKSGAYRGSTYTVPDKVTDPAGYNTYLRRLLQGGTLDTPDKAMDAAGYAAWIDAFTSSIIADMEYVHANLGRIVRWSLQNEPENSTAYPSCLYTDQLYYDVMKSVVPKIRASSALSTYGGVANRIFIYPMDGGPAGIGCALIRADSALLAEIDGWSWHKITEAADNAGAIVAIKDTLLANANGKPVFTDENEYFDQHLVPGTASYRTPEFRTANTALQVINWLVAVGSPTWYWIHIGKPTNTSPLEREGRSLVAWRPPGTAAPSDLPSLQEGYFSETAVNWNALEGFIRYMPRGSVRLDFGRSQTARQSGVLAWRRTDGKIVFCLTNRATFPYPIRVASATALTMDRFLYSTSQKNASIGPIAVTTTTDVTIAPFTIEFWVQQ